MRPNTMERRRLRPDNAVPTPAPGDDADSTRLILVGYNATTGEPIYEESPCVSNDNPAPYDNNCTEVPTGSPTSVPTYIVSAVDGGQGGSGKSYAVVDEVVRAVSCPNAPASSTPAVNTAEEDENVLVVTYAYEVETANAPSADAFLPGLEERILLNLADSMMSCQRRRDLQKALRAGRVLDAGGEEFSVVGIRSKPEDVAVVEGPCTISEPGADNCFAIDGKLTLLLDPPSDDAAYDAALAGANATDAAQENLKEAMEDDDLLTPSIPEVIKVRYLADSYDEYMAGFAGGGSGLGAGAAVGLPGGSARGGGDEGGVSPWLGIMLGGVFGALVVILFALLFVVRRRRSQAKYRQADGNRRLGTGDDMDWEAWDDGIDVNDPRILHAALLAGRMGSGHEVVLHVDNLSPHTDEDQVRALFEEHGTVQYVTFMPNPFIPQDHRSSQKALDKQDTRLYEDAGGCATCRAPDCSGCQFGGGRMANSQSRYAFVDMPATNEAERTQAESTINHIDGLEVEGHALANREVTTLYVGNMSPNTTEDDIRRIFEQNGSVIGCCVPADHDNSDSGDDPNGRFALVTMPVEEAEQAVARVHGMEVDGYVLTVRDIRHMTNGRPIPGSGLVAAALSVGAAGAVTGFGSRQFNAEGNEYVTLYVGNLSPDATEEGVRRVFEQYGTVIDCTMPPTKEGRERYALVTMPADDAERAMNCLDGVEDDGLTLIVREARLRGGGIESMEGRNLADDSSSDHDAHDQEDADEQVEEKEKPPGVLAAVGAIAGFMVAPFIKPCKKRRHHEDQLAHLESVTGRSYARGHRSEEQSLDDGLDAIIAGIDGDADTEDKRNFVVDPPGAFHLGNHHYTSAGVRYFSPLCELCVAARANADGVVALKAVDERDENESLYGEGNGLSFDLEAAKKFTDFSSNDLGRYHSSMHVRHCKSTTCVICQKEKGVYFVKSRKNREEAVV